MIPYTIERRADTGVNNVTLGIWLFIASEVMLFGALFSSYALLRVSAPIWPRGFDVLGVWFGAANTVVLSIMTALILRARALDARAARRLVLAGSALAIVFLVIKGFEWRGEIGNGLRAVGQHVFRDVLHADRTPRAARHRRARRATRGRSWAPAASAKP